MWLFGIGEPPPPHTHTHAHLINFMHALETLGIVVQTETHDSEETDCPLSDSSQRSVPCPIDRSQTASFVIQNNCKSILLLERIRVGIQRLERLYAKMPL